MKISIQTDDFNIQEETEYFRRQGNSTGAIVTFSGLVRDFYGDIKVSSLLLEHYPGMTEKSLEQIVEQASSRWPILDTTIIHRVGELKAGDQIVFVAVSSEHRHAAFNACEFIMDYLKTQAPFWKKTREENGEHWVEAQESDFQAADKW